MKVTVSERAYVKLVLHAVKHPTRDVLGALVGKFSGEDVEVTDALPMVHSTLSVTPTVEIALEQFAAHAEIEGGLRVVGVYLANERAGDVSLGANASSVANVVRNSSPTKNAVVVVMDSEQLFSAGAGSQGGEPRPAHGLHLMRCPGEGTRWERVGGQSGSLEIPEDASKAALALARDRDAVRNLVDFDDHLDDPGLDWRNGKIDALVSR